MATGVFAYWPGVSGKAHLVGHLVGQLRHGGRHDGRHAGRRRSDLHRRSAPGPMGRNILHTATLRQARLQRTVVWAPALASRSRLLLHSHQRSAGPIHRQQGRAWRAGWQPADRGQSRTGRRSRGQRVPRCRGAGMLMEASCRQARAGEARSGQQGARQVPHGGYPSGRRHLLLRHQRQGAPPRCRPPHRRCPSRSAPCPRRPDLQKKCR